MSDSTETTKVAITLALTATEFAYAWACMRMDECVHKRIVAGGPVEYDTSLKLASAAMGIARHNLGDAAVEALHSRMLAGGFSVLQSQVAPKVGA